MQFDEIFEAYYTLYRAESETPDTSDDEYIVAMRLANEAIQRWANYDGTYWKELFAQGTLSSVSGTNTYTAPSDMQEVGGFIKLGMTSVRIVDPQEKQFQGDMGNYVFFTGNPGNGYTLNFNRGVTVDGVNNITFTYYKKPDLITAGTDIPEMSNPYFMVHRMLAQRFRVSRNPYYQSALRDSEDALKIMKMDNDSGSWANPFSVPDRSGTVWGSDMGGTWSW